MTANDFDDESPCDFSDRQDSIGSFLQYYKTIDLRSKPSEASRAFGQSFLRRIRLFVGLRHSLRVSTSSKQRSIAKIISILEDLTRGPLNSAKTWVVAAALMLALAFGVSMASRSRDSVLIQFP